MTKAEFEATKAGLSCKWCGAARSLGRREGTEQSERGVWCETCNRFQFWLSKDGNHSKLGTKRPALKRGTKDEVWAAFGDRCFHCGCERTFLEAVGIELTVQHVPPYHVAGHGAWLYPYCAWCNQDAAGRWKHMEALAARFRVMDYFHTGDGIEPDRE